MQYQGLLEGSPSWGMWTFFHQLIHQFYTHMRLGCYHLICLLFFPTRNQTPITSSSHTHMEIALTALTWNSEKKVCETQSLRTLGNTEVIFGIQPPWRARGVHTVLGSRWCRPRPMLSPDPYTLTWVNWVNSQNISTFDKIVTEFWIKFLSLQRITILIPKQDESPFTLYFTPSDRFP